jgi:hypothetical protein
MDKFSEIWAEIKREIKYHNVNEHHTLDDEAESEEPKSLFLWGPRCNICGTYIHETSRPYAFIKQGNLVKKMFCSPVCYDEYMNSLRQLVIPTKS